MRITSKGQATIPAEIREKAGLFPDTEVEFRFDGKTVSLVAVAGGRRPSRGARLVINPVVYAGYRCGSPGSRMSKRRSRRISSRESRSLFEAAFLAGKSFQVYRSRGGQRRSPLPDLFTGAHAVIAGYELLTRDAGRYRSYYPGLALIAPD
ncbi:MAG TPA: AbrB/MazE/SpoVT family DNA-binding domain-containing protein [Caulobacteraceae bacterium]|nr:AbrB/MazE/SpoVT family DNA-binding domain-containing protein [Caulobacteraceae bacterium]